jgi:transcription elongation GreA/GreB family factor
MSGDTYCQLTTKDVSVLEGMLDRLEEQALADARIARLLRRKLAAARICFRDDIDPRVATINSRVQYRIGKGPIETRVITHGGESALPGLALPISNIHGLALLGLTADDTITVEAADGHSEVLHVLDIIQQPEAARLKAQKPVTAVFTNAAMSNVRTIRRPEPPEDDDPGPQAA